MNIYAENKKEIDKISIDKTLNKNETSEKIQAIFENSDIAKQAETEAKIIREEQRKNQEKWNNYDKKIRDIKSEIYVVDTKINEQFINNLPQEKIRTSPNGNMFYNASNGKGELIERNKLNNPSWKENHLKQLSFPDGGYRDAKEPRLKGLRIEYLEDANKAYSLIDKTLLY